jgi:pyrimidine-specific ribonucleoside hydrolase
MGTAAIVDYDIGYDWDDTAAHLLFMASPEIDVELIVTNDEEQGKRAIFARQLLRARGVDVPVVRGTDLGNRGAFLVEDLLDDLTPVDGAWEDAILRCVQRHDEVTYIGLGAMTNVARFVQAYPAYAGKLRLVQMGGAICSLYRHGDRRAEHNVFADRAALLTVLQSDVSARFVMNHTTQHRQIEVDPGSPVPQEMRRLDRADLTLAVAHLDRWYAKRGHGSYLHDPLTCSAVIRDDLVAFATARFVVSGDGCMHLPADSKAELRGRVGAQLSPNDPFRVYLDDDSGCSVAGESFEICFSYAASYHDFMRLFEQRVVA